MDLQANQDIIDDLLQKFESKTLYSSILFVGSRGIGKATLIKELIKKIIKKESTFIEQGLQIKMLENHSHPDVFNFGNRDIEDEKMTVEGVRKVIDFTNTLPSILSAKFIIIDSINEMNNESCNAILKILEEPRPNVYFFIICHNLSTVIKTVVSRCIKVNIPTPNYDNAVKILSLMNNNHLNEIPKYVFLSQNSPGEALFLMEKAGMEIYKQFCLDVVNKTTNSAKIIIKISPHEIEKIIIIFVTRIYNLILDFGFKKQEILALTEEKQIINIIQKSNNIEYVINNFSRILQIIRNITILNNNHMLSWHQVLLLLNL